MGNKNRGVDDIVGPLRIVTDDGFVRGTKVYIGDLDVTDAMQISKIVLDIDADNNMVNAKILLFGVHLEMTVNEIKTIFKRFNNFCPRCGYADPGRFCQRCSNFIE